MSTPSTRKTPARKTPAPRTPPRKLQEGDEIDVLLEALRELSEGKFEVRLDGRARGRLGELASTFNTLATQLDTSQREINRVGLAISHDGRTSERLVIDSVQGSFRTMVDDINGIIGDLVRPSTEVARVITAVAHGDLSQKASLDLEGKPIRGEFLRLAETVNTMVDQLRSLAAEVTRVAREVGTEGKLGGQAHVPGVAGTWKDLTDNVNSMASNLTTQVRGIAVVVTAVANGDLTKRLALDAKGEIAALSDTINFMTDTLRVFADQVTTVAREVGTEGKLGGQAHVPGVAGTWKDLTDNVNLMASNLTDQVRSIAIVTTAIANGDLNQKITVDVKGELLELKNTINTMVDQLRSFAAEVTRVATEVGTEGQLGGQAQVTGVAGTWKNLTDSVNRMASNLTDQVRSIAVVTTAIANGDLNQKITVDVKGEMLELKNTINTMVDQLRSFAAEVTRVATEVGTEGQLGGQAQVIGIAGTWKNLTDSVNRMASNLTDQVRSIAIVTTAIAKGDLNQKITVDVKGEMLELKNTINTMVDQLRSFAAEVTRVATEVGTEGKLGGQAHVPGVAGTWKDLTDNVNRMASNLTDQVRSIAIVTTAIANGDLNQKITVDVKGEMLELKNTINTMVDQLRSFAAEVTRVATEVGTEGKLGGQAQVTGVAGTWKNLTDSVNRMASNLTDQVRSIAIVTTAIANGDLNQKITVDVKGEMLELKNTINTMVDQLRSFAAEVTRVATEVGTEGQLGGQAQVTGVAGTWKNLTDSVNRMASNLTDQVRSIAVVTTAIANGDLNQKITVDVKGELLELKNTMNTMVDQLRSFAAEVTRVAREVGTEGKLGGQAHVPGVAGTWKDLTDSVNLMASNLTDQVRNIALVTTAVANGDLSQKITVNVRGELLEMKNTINTMVDQLRSFAAEVTRVAIEVGTEGKLGGQARVLGVGGTWKDLTDSVNRMASNLTDQVRNIALVTTAVANGDLSQKITVDVKGELLELKNTINTMVDQLRSFAAEVTRVAREVGTEGKLGGQAHVPGVAGTWKDLTDNVNSMASNLTDQVRNIALVTTAVANGDLSQKITVDVRGEMLEMKNTINTMVDQLRSFAAEVTRVAREVGTEGKLGGQAFVPGVAGTWKDLTDNVNSMASNLTTQVRGIGKVVTAVANGDLSRRLVLDAKGEIAELAETINDMTETLGIFADQVTTVAREVGTEGKLGGQARVPGVAGTWKDLTDNVNSMATNLTLQVRGIVKVVTAVANGDLSQKLVMDARGELAALADTINSMTDTLRLFAEQVTTVARQVGIEGKLGGQAEVPGAAGTWRALTDNVNQLAGNLTSQVRAIADVATAVTKGDLSRTIDVEAQGELLALKDNVNQMIAKLRETTSKNQEQDWLKTNLARFSAMMQGQKNLVEVSSLIMRELTPLVGAHHGAFFIAEGEGNQMFLRLIASYAYKERKGLANKFRIGEGLVGQSALEKKSIIITNVPGDYVHIQSGLGEATPYTIILLPVLFEGQVRAVIELASFRPFNSIQQTFMDQLAESIGVVLNMINASMRTEELLQQSQGMAQELQAQQGELKKSNSELEAQAASLKKSEELLRQQQEELQQINEELEEKATLLSEQKAKIEQKNREVEQAKIDLEEKARQVALSSKYKSEFLANMSHELRTPLNSLLILSKLLIENRDQNLTKKQVEFAQTIFASGTDLLNLINEVLDLSKVEAGKMDIYVSEVLLGELEGYLDRSFGPLASQKGLTFGVERAPGVPASLYTDGQRLQQILRNLVANALKFTERGSVTVRIVVAPPGTAYQRDELRQSPVVIAFEVRDTGIGIAKDKHRLIFEAFQQADGTTSRRFGGTGLGLSISRELTRLLGGEIHLTSAPGQGSTFTLFLPERLREVEPISVLPSVTTELAQGPKHRTTEPAELPPASEVPSIPDVNLSNHRPVDDDLEVLTPNDRSLLIIEDDLNFAKVLMATAREAGFKVVVATRGDTGLAMAHKIKPDAVLLDLVLPVIDGMGVLERLKRHPTTRHIPVHIISGRAEKHRSLQMGAMAFLEKPVSQETLQRAFQRLGSFLSRTPRRLLVVEDNEVQRRSIVELIGHDDVEITAVDSAEGALKALREQTYDCMVLDLGLPDVSGFDLLEQIRRDEALQGLPIVVYTGRALTRPEETKLKRLAETIIVKDTQSPERLLDETALFLHRVEANLPEAKRHMLSQLHQTDQVLSNKKVLVVDDDVRNVFALTSILEGQGMVVVYAENGREGISTLKANEDVSIVLMDVMMPEMDGYETIREIRKLPEYRDLPILAVTAKAMKGDREKCIEAGASDYVTKPVDPDRLISMLKMWLYR